MSTHVPPAAAPTGTAPAGRRSSDGRAGSCSVIAHGTLVAGDVSGDVSLEVAGRLEGSAHVKGFCHIAAEGSVQGDIAAATIVIEGRVEGSTLVADKVELGARAQVRADVYARIVAVAEGAVLDGEVRMGEGEPAAAPIKFKEKRRDRGVGGVSPVAALPPAPAQAPAPAATQAPEPAAEPAAALEPPPALKS